MRRERDSKTKYKSSFKLFAYGKDKDKYQIRLRVTFGGQRQDFSTGCQVYDKSAWDEQNELVRDGYLNPRGGSALQINNELRNIKDQMETSFKYFEALDIIPTPKQLADKFEERLHGTVPKKPATEQKKTDIPKEPDFFKVYDEFMFECGEKNAWTEATFEKMRAMLEDYKAFRPKLKFSDLTEKTLTQFVVYLRDEKQLRTPRKAKGERDNYDEDDVTGLKNSTIKKKLGYMRWFLNWATGKGYNTNTAYKTFVPTLKQTQKKVIYLSKEELKAVRDLELKGDDVFLEPVRDIFLFCCFSSLRYSDVSSLKWNDVKEDRIEATTVKTADSISIEINDMMRSILDKYKDVPSKNGLVFPYYTNQAMNRDIKVLCRIAGIDQEERITTYRGNERIDEIKKKYELVGTHTGRRTFIVNALSRGIAPSVVMKWTGHASYNSMKPYIDIVDTIKASEMSKMNFMD